MHSRTGEDTYPQAQQEVLEEAAAAPLELYHNQFNNIVRAMTSRIQISKHDQHQENTYPQVRQGVPEVSALHTNRHNVSH